MAALQDVGPDGDTIDVTAGWLRGSLREVDEAASRPGAPALPCRNPQAIPLGKDVVYRIPLVPNARRFKAGHRIRLVLPTRRCRHQQPEHGSVVVAAAAAGARIARG